MHCVNKDLWRLRIHILGNTVSQIEDMPLPLTKLGQNARHFRFNLRRSTIEHGRIHIALQCYLVTDPGSGIRYGGTPVQSQGIAASGRHHLEPLSPPPW